MDKAKLLATIKDDNKKFSAPNLPETPKVSDKALLASLQLKLKYESAWAIKLIRYCEKGNSVEAFCGEHKISPTQIELWGRNNPEFEEALKLAQAIQLWYWEKQLEQAMRSTDDLGVDSDLVKICKLRLENLGYSNKEFLKNKVVFKDNLQANKKRLESQIKTHQDAAETTSEELTKLLEAYNA